MVLSQNAEEASTLWLLRKTASTRPHYSLADLAKLDGRLEAHLDGLRIAGGVGWKACEEQLAANEVGEVFAAGVLACESANPELMAKVLSVLEEEPELAGGLTSALGWPPFEQLQSYIRGLLQSNHPVHQFIGIGAAAIHRQHPGQALSLAMRSEDLRLRARALKAAGELQDKALVREVTEALGHAEPG